MYINLKHSVVTFLQLYSASTTPTSIPSYSKTPLDIVLKYSNVLLPVSPLKERNHSTKVNQCKCCFTERYMYQFDRKWGYDFFFSFYMATIYLQCNKDFDFLCTVLTIINGENVRIFIEDFCFKKPKLLMDWFCLRSSTRKEAFSFLSHNK